MIPVRRGEGGRFGAMTLGTGDDGRQPRSDLQGPAVLVWRGVPFWSRDWWRKLVFLSMQKATLGTGDHSRQPPPGHCEGYVRYPACGSCRPGWARRATVIWRCEGAMVGAPPVRNSDAFHCFFFRLQKATLDIQPVAVAGLVGPAVPL